jgi:tetratricopeptide (TPR) repeat protein
MAALAIVAACACLFIPVMGFDFVNWDDDLYVYNNPSLEAFGWTPLRRWFTEPYVRLYVPLPMLSYALDHALWGFHPGGYHFTNLALHLANMLWVFALFSQVFGDPLLAALGALLFAVHPVQVESVAWISERKNLLFAFCVLGGTWAFVRKREDEAPWKSYASSALWLLGALLSKVTAVMMPFILLAHGYFFRARTTPLPSNRAWWYGGMLAAVLIAGALTLSLYPDILKGYGANPGVNFIWHPLYRYAVYVKHVLWPAGLSLFYPLPPDPRNVPGLLVKLTLLGVAIAAAVGSSVFLKPRAGFWLAWFLVWLAPVSTLLPVPLADHHLYLPVAGAVGLVLSALQRFRGLALAALVLSTAACFPFSAARLMSWRTSETLWRSELERNPKEYRALLHLANHYADSGKAEDAAEAYEKVLALYPGWPQTFLNLGNLYLSQGDAGRAASVLERFRLHHPEHPDLALLRASLVFQQGNREEARRELELAAEQGSTNPAVYVNLAKMALEENRSLDAASRLEQALSHREAPAEAYFLLTVALNHAGRWKDAVRAAERLEARGLDYPGIFFQKGYAHLKLGEREKAREAYLMSAKRHRGVAEAFYHLGLMSVEERDGRQARSFITEALRLRPDSATYRKMLEDLNDAAG